MGTLPDCRYPKQNTFFKKAFIATSTSLRAQARCQTFEHLVQPGTQHPVD